MTTPNDFSGILGTNWGADIYNPFPGAGEYRTPAEEWGRFTATQPGRAFWQTRAPLQDLGQRLAGRYLLAAPEMGQITDTPVSFGEYIRGYQGMQGDDGVIPGYYAQNAATLRARATEAARAATTPTGEYMAGFTEGTPDFAQRAWRSRMFGPEAENAMENQRAVANALALRREGGGSYQGQMADAIRNAMYRMQQYRTNLGAPRESFLDWYLGQTAPAEPATE